VFIAFQTNLTSKNTLKRVFDKYHLMNVFQPNIDSFEGRERTKQESLAFNEFVKTFSISPPSKKEPTQLIEVSLSLPMTELEVTNILNDLIKTAEHQTIDQFYRQLTAEKQNGIKMIQDQIVGARKVQQDRRLDRIAELSEAIVITKQLGIQKPISAGPTMNINNLNNQKGQNVSLYLLGSDLLEAEKNVLITRQNDDAFIENLRSWQEQAQQLQSLKLEKDKFGVLAIDQAAEIGEKVKPKKSLIIAVGAVLGLMLGVFIALIRRAVKKRTLDKIDLNKTGLATPL
jgi:chain length determinant protein (polysaccharide antigen chain regulator)